MLFVFFLGVLFISFQSFKAEVMGLVISSIEKDQKDEGVHISSWGWVLNGRKV